MFPAEAVKSIERLVSCCFSEVGEINTGGPSRKRKTRVTMINFTILVVALVSASRLESEVCIQVDVARACTAIVAHETFLTPLARSAYASRVR